MRSAASVADPRGSLNPFRLFRRIVVAFTCRAEERARRKGPGHFGRTDSCVQKIARNRRWFLEAECFSIQTR